MQLIELCPSIVDGVVAETKSLDLSFAAFGVLRATDVGHTRQDEGKGLKGYEYNIYNMISTEGSLTNDWSLSLFSLFLSALIYRFSPLLMTRRKGAVFAAMIDRPFYMHFSPSFLFFTSLPGAAVGLKINWWGKGRRGLVEAVLSAVLLCITMPRKESLKVWIWMWGFEMWRIANEKKG